MAKGCLHAGDVAALQKVHADEDIEAVLLPTEQPQSRVPSVTGLVVVLMNQVANVASSEVMQRQEQKGYDGPYFSIWLNHSLTGGCMFIAGMVMMHRLESEPTDLSQQMRDAGFSSLRNAIKWSVLMIVLYKFNIFWAAATPHTAVVVFMAISQSACVLVMILSVLFLREKLTGSKVGSVLLCMGGVALVSWSSHGGTTTAAGLLWTVLCTVGLAVYSVVWGYKFPAKTTQTQVCLFLGLMGAANTLLLWPPCFFIGDPGLGWAPWQLNLPERSQWALVMTMGGLAVFSNFSFMLGISLTSPMFMAVGSIVQLPLAAVADRIFHGKVPSLTQVAGYLAISIGFLVLVHENHKLNSDEQQNVLDKGRQEDAGEPDGPIIDRVSCPGTLLDRN